MAKYGERAQKSVESAVRRQRSGTLKSGKGGSAGKVKSRKQAIAIGLSEARKQGAKVPSKNSSSSGKATARKSSSRKESKSG